MGGGAEQRRGVVDREGPSKIRGSGNAWRAFPLLTMAQEACWAPGPGPPFSRALLGCGGLRGIGWKEKGGKRRRGRWEGPLGLEE